LSDFSTAIFHPNMHSLESSVCLEFYVILYSFTTRLHYLFICQSVTQNMNVWLLILIDSQTYILCMV